MGKASEIAGTEEKKEPTFVTIKSLKEKRNLKYT